VGENIRGKMWYTLFRTGSSNRRAILDKMRQSRRVCVSRDYWQSCDVNSDVTRTVATSTSTPFHARRPCLPAVDFRTRWGWKSPRFGARGGGTCGALIVLSCVQELSERSIRAARALVNSIHPVQPWYSVQIPHTRRPHAHCRYCYCNVCYLLRC